MKYYVQQTIGGWRQNATYCGTLEECEAYAEKRHLNAQTGWAIVSEYNYRVDYL